MTTLARLEGAGKSYGVLVPTRALYPTNLEIKVGEVCCILGPSGSGKTTLLNLLGGLDRPSEGKVVVDGHDLGGLPRGGLTLFRRRSVGFVFQFFNLVPSLTARENVLVAGELVGGKLTDADDWLARVGLAGLENRFPSELSGGQQQRVAIARALAKKPQLLLADEPTGALDHEAGARVIALLVEAGHQGRCTVVLVTHDEVLAAAADRVFRMRDGRIISDERGQAPTSAHAET